VVGIIGRNGAGKSTLLKILSRITTPTRGEVRLGGQVASLLEVGTGFHPELTGRENIYLNGAIMGMRRADIRARFDEIVAFSGLERFIDTPVKNYSSGMYLRLGFSIAVSAHLDVILVDEVLGVGDEDFQRRSVAKFDELRREGRTIVLVTHGLDLVERMCDRAILLADGAVAGLGPAGEVVERYRQLVSADADASTGAPVRPERNLEILAVEYADAEARPLPVSRSPLRVLIHWRASQPVKDPVFHLDVFSRGRGRHLLEARSDADGWSTGAVAGAGVVEFSVPELPLGSGDYLVRVAVSRLSNGGEFDHQCTYPLVVAEGDDLSDTRLIRLPGRWRESSYTPDQTTRFGPDAARLVTGPA